MALHLLPRLSSHCKLIRLGSLLLKALIFLPLPLLCQSRPVSSVSIPFTFSTGTRTMPAGDYIVSRLSDHIYSLRKTNGSVAQSMVVLDASVTKAPESSKLLFRNYRGKYFLASIWSAGSREGFQIMIGKAEKELLASAQDASSQGTLVALDMRPPLQH